MAKLAFLTEVRDCEKYLAEAIESILGQSYTDFVYYITDDGSSDSTRDIISTYAAKDTRIILAYYENDMMGNFNKTLLKIYASDAQYFALLDADDWYESDFAETMISLLENNNTDLAEAKFIAHYENEDEQDELPGFGDAIISREDFVENFAFYSFFDSIQQWWCKIYRISILKELSLLAGVGWDTEFVLRYRTGCKSFAVCDRALHHYRIRENSDCHKRINEFDAKHVSEALCVQHEAREKLLVTSNTQSLLMGAYQDINGVKSNMMRIYAGDISNEIAAKSLPSLLRLPFLGEAYKAIEHMYEESGTLFFAPPEASTLAMESIRSYYGFFLRLTYYYIKNENTLIFEWLCRVFTQIAEFFEPEDLPLLMDDVAIPILERNYRRALLGICNEKNENKILLKVFICVHLHTQNAFLQQFRKSAENTLSEKKKTFLDLHMGK